MWRHVKKLLIIPVSPKLYLGVNVWKVTAPALKVRYNPDARWRAAFSCRPAALLRSGSYDIDRRLSHASRSNRSHIGCGSEDSASPWRRAVPPAYEPKQLFRRFRPP